MRKSSGAMVLFYGSVVIVLLLMVALVVACEPSDDDDKYYHLPSTSHSKSHGVQKPKSTPKNKFYGGSQRRKR